MSLLSPPQIPLFRITLFYGPEEVEGASDSLHCVFNVKKRSWKGGVQVEVVMQKTQISRLQDILQHPVYLEESLKGFPIEDREAYLVRSKDLLVQLLCFYKLQIFIQQGIRQENVRIAGESLVAETDTTIQGMVAEIQRQISIELDLEHPEESH